MVPPGPPEVLGEVLTRAREVLLDSLAGLPDRDSRLPTRQHAVTTASVERSPQGPRTPSPTRTDDPTDLRGEVAQLDQVVEAVRESPQARSALGQRVRELGPESRLAAAVEVVGLTETLDSEPTEPLQRPRDLSALTRSAPEAQELSTWVRSTPAALDPHRQHSPPREVEQPRVRSVIDAARQVVEQRDEQRVPPRGDTDQPEGDLPPNRTRSVTRDRGPAVIARPPTEPSGQRDGVPTTEHRGTVGSEPRNPPQPAPPQRPPTDEGRRIARETVRQVREGRRSGQNRQEVVPPGDSRGDADPDDRAIPAPTRRPEPGETERTELRRTGTTGRSPRALESGTDHRADGRDGSNGPRDDQGGPEL